jgi:hypothetical protein
MKLARKSRPWRETTPCGLARAHRTGRAQRQRLAQRIGVRRHRRCVVVDHAGCATGRGSLLYLAASQGPVTSQRPESILKTADTAFGLVSEGFTASPVVWAFRRSIGGPRRGLPRPVYSAGRPGAERQEPGAHSPQSRVLHSAGAHRAISAAAAVRSAVLGAFHRLAVRPAARVDLGLRERQTAMKGWWRREVAQGSRVTAPKTAS